MGNAEDGFQEPIEVISYGEGGYHVKVRNEYSFIACSSGIGMDFKAANKEQVDELIQVLEGVLEKVRSSKIRDEIFAEIERRIKEECGDE